jgi:hypothetical protein
MEKNTELAYKTLDYIREHPEEWSQRTWVCETAACFAGRAVLIGLELEGWHGWQGWRSGTPENTAAAARRLLGWTYEEGDHVFHNFTSDFTELERAVKEVLNGEVG